MWYKKLEEINEEIDSFGSDILFFRGHSDESWELKPTLGRIEGFDSDLERLAYFDFVTRAGILLKENKSSWDNLFAMQHHGVPTRLLDWSENFSVALHFALKNMDDSDGCIWILDPFALNEKATNQKVLLNQGHVPVSYESCYMNGEVKLGSEALALSPNRHHPRVFQQKSGFTLHDNIDVSLEKLYPNVTRKIIIPNSLKEDAQRFLELAGVNDFSLFPDLDGLARLINREHFSGA